MTLDINSPADSVQIADLPRYIRETRAAITTTGVTGASFETGVLTGDAVYLDSVNNVWRRSLAGDPTRGKFHGFADIDQGLVVIWGFFTSQAWAFADGATIYVSGSDLGALTDIDTGIAVGVCIAGDTILIDSQISSSFTALRDEITAARDGAVDLHTKLETMDAARGVVADEITAARGGAATLANRLSLIDSSIGTVTEEVEVSRGDAATLGQRLDVSLNPDGSLKTTTSVSNFATESAAILYVNSTTFTVAGDKTAIYVANRTIRCNSSSALIGYVSSSSYDGGTGLTTVVVTGVTVPVSLSTIEYSFHPNEMPRMAHSGLTGILGADPSSSDVTTNKHVSNNQLKVLTDGKQPLDATLTALAGLVTSANKIVLATGADAFSMIPFNSPAQSIGAAADAAAVRGVLGLGNAAVKNVGTGSGDVAVGNHNHSSVYQPLDAELTAIAGLTSAADKLPYFTGSGTAALANLTTFARTVLDDTNALGMRGTIDVYSKAEIDSLVAGAGSADLSLFNGLMTQLHLDRASGPVPSGYFWLFKTDELATKTGAAWDPTSHYYSSGSASTAYANAGGTGDRRASLALTVPSATYWNNTVVEGLINGATSVEAGSFTATGVPNGDFFEVDFGAGAKKVITELKLYQSNTASHGVWKVQGKVDGGSSFADLGSSFTLGGATTSTHAVNATYTKGYRYYRFTKVSGSTSNSPYLYEFEFKIGDWVGANMTLVPTAITAAEHPANVSAYLLHKAVDAVTLNTDLKLRVSTDNGSNWSAFGMLEEICQYDTDYKLLKADIAVSGLSGTSVKWEVTTNNNKLQQVRAAAMLLA